MVLGFVGLKNKKTQCKKTLYQMFGDIWKTLCLICHASAQWQQDRQQQYHKSFGECASCKTNSSRRIAWKCRVVFEEYKIIKLRNSHYSRCLSRNVKVVRLCLLNIKSSDWKINIIQGVWVEMSKLWGCVWEINQPARKLPLAVSFT